MSVNYAGNIQVVSSSGANIPNYEFPSNDGSAEVSIHNAIIVNSKKVYGWGYNLNFQATGDTRSGPTYTTFPTSWNLPHWPLYNTNGDPLYTLANATFQSIVASAVIEKVILSANVSFVLVNYGPEYSKKLYGVGDNSSRQQGNSTATDCTRFRGHGYFGNRFPIEDVYHTATVYVGGVIGSETVVAIKPNKTDLILWGRDATNAGATTINPSAVATLPNGETAKKVLSSCYSLIVLTEQGNVYGMGGNSGTWQLGNGTTLNSLGVWTQVRQYTTVDTNLTDVYDIWMSGTNNNSTYYAVKNDGSLWAWGTYGANNVRTIFAGPAGVPSIATLAPYATVINKTTTNGADPLYIKLDRGFATSGGGGSGATTSVQCFGISPAGGLYVWGEGGQGNGFNGTTDITTATQIATVCVDGTLGYGAVNQPISLGGIYGTTDVWDKVFTQGSLAGAFAITKPEYGGQLYHLGWNAMGQSGCGDSIDHLEFTLVPTDESVSEVYCHGYTDGTSVNSFSTIVKGVSGRLYVVGGADGFDAPQPYMDGPSQNTYKLRELVLPS